MPRERIFSLTTVRHVNTQVGVVNNGYCHTLITNLGFFPACDVTKNLFGSVNCIFNPMSTLLGIRLPIFCKGQYN